MKKYRRIGLMLMVFGILINLTICRAEVSPFKPEWKIGDTWKIEFQERDTIVSMFGGVPQPEENEVMYGNFSEPSFYIFKVIEIKNIEGEECFEVKVSEQEDNKEKPLMYFYYTADNLKLKATQEINENNTRGFLKHPDEKKGPVVEDFMLGLWLSWSDFTQLGPANSPQIFPQSGNKMQQLIEVNGDTLKIVWYLAYNEADSSWKVSITQVWRKGDLWWDTYEVADSKQIADVPGREGYLLEKAHAIFTSDSQPPQISLTVTPDTLWPANHQMVEIKPQITVSDNQDPSPVVTLESVTSSELDDAPGVGDGNTTGDIQTTSDGKILLRAERDGKGTGRIYTITYTAPMPQATKHLPQPLLSCLMIWVNREIIKCLKQKTK